MRDFHVFQSAYDASWAIYPEKLAAIAVVLDAHAAGIERASYHDAVEESLERAAARDAASSPSGVGVLRLHGTLIPRGNTFAESSGAMSLERARAQLLALDSNPAVGAIVLDIDSPGGMVQGVPEFHSAVMATEKPVIAQVWNTAASGAYWIASAADEIVITPSGEVGSIGVLAIHYDRSKALDTAGVKPTVITAGKFKAELSPFGPLSDETLAHVQARVDEDYERFVRAVATGRNVSQAKARNEFGEGRMVGAEDAVRRGMVDRIATFEETVARVLKKLHSKQRVATARETRAAIRRRLAVEIGMT